MTESDTQSGFNLYSIWATFSIILAQVLLLFGLIYNRLTVARIHDISIWSLAFQIFLVTISIFTITIFWLLFRGVLHRVLRKAPLWGIGGVFFGVFGVAFALPQTNLIPVYLDAPLILWGFFFSLGIFTFILERYQSILPISLIVRSLALIGFGIFFSLVMLELGLRFYFTMFGSQADKVSYVYSVEKAMSLNNRYIGMPYLNYALSPNYPGHNSQGFRGPELIMPKPDGTFRIFSLGGSTTYGSSLSPQDAYPAQLEQILHEQGFSNIEVVNAGVEAYSSHDSLANFAYHILDYDPDMVIVYHAVNDVNARLIDPEIYNGINMRQGIWSTARLEREISSFTLVRFVQIALTGEPNLNNVQVAFFNPTEVTRCDLGNECDRLGLTPEEVLHRNPPTFFERNLRNIAAIAAMQDVEVLLSTWAYYPDEIENTSSVMSRSYYQNAVEEHNQIIRTLGLQLDIPVADFREAMPPTQESWLDTMHLSAIGAQRQAEFYADFLINNQLIPAPAASFD